MAKSLVADDRTVRLKKVQNATVNRSVLVLRQALYWRIDEQLVDANPLA